MEILIFLFSFVLTVFLLGGFVFWLIHMFSTFSKDENWGFGNFAKFRKQFNEINNSKEKWQKDSSFNHYYSGRKNTSTYYSNNERNCRSSIESFRYKFNDAYMVISNPFSFILVEIFLIRYRVIGIKKYHKW